MNPAAFAQDFGNEVRRELNASKWWASSDSNREPNDYEPFALTIELEARIEAFSTRHSGKTAEHKVGSWLLASPVLLKSYG